MRRGSCFESRDHREQKGWSLETTVKIKVGVNGRQAKRKEKADGKEDEDEVGCRVWRLAIQALLSNQHPQLDGTLAFGAKKNYLFRWPYR